MRNPQITTTTDSRYPLQTSVIIDPADYDRLVRRIDARRGLKIVHVHDEVGHAWTIDIACASERMAEEVQAWEM